MPNLTNEDKLNRVSQNEARRRKEVALARIREMEADQRARKLIPSDQVDAAWAEIRTRIKTAVLRLPDKCAPPSGGAQGPPRSPGRASERVRNDSEEPCR